MLCSRMQESLVALGRLGVLLQLWSCLCGENCTKGLPVPLAFCLLWTSSIATKQEQLLFL